MSETIIEVRNLKKRYTLGKGNHVDALRDALLEIRAGEMVATMGPSGSGKSTMMHVIGCLDTPDSGEVYTGGTRVNGVKGRTLAALTLSLLST